MHRNYGSPYLLSVFGSVPLHISCFYYFLLIVSCLCTMTTDKVCVCCDDLRWMPSLRYYEEKVYKLLCPWELNIDHFKIQHKLYHVTWIHSYNNITHKNHWLLYLLLLLLLLLLLWCSMNWKFIFLQLFFWINATFIFDTWLTIFGPTVKCSRICFWVRERKFFDVFLYERTCNMLKNGE